MTAYAIRFCDWCAQQVIGTGDTYTDAAVEAERLLDAHNDSNCRSAA